MEQKTIYYISEAARKVQVESHVLRYWEDELELPIMRNEMGHRCYTEQDIRQLQEIKQLKEQGLQLKAIRTVLLRMPATSDGTAEDILMQQAVSAKEDTDTAEGKTEAERDENTGTGNDSMDSMKSMALSEERSISDNMIDNMHDQASKYKHSEMDIDKPQRFVVALSKDKDNPSGQDQNYAEDDKTRKAARLQYLLQHMITEAVKSANKELCSDVKESILKELDYQFRMQEERDEERWKKEEEHYRKIDEMIRERHRPKERLGRGKKKSPARDESINP